MEGIVAANAEMMEMPPIAVVIALPESMVMTLSPVMEMPPNAVVIGLPELMVMMPSAVITKLLAALHTDGELVAKVIELLGKLLQSNVTTPAMLPVFAAVISSTTVMVPVVILGVNVRSPHVIH